jgi:23S rRNA (uracil1939-C5)-methyltransferase
VLVGFHEKKSSYVADMRQCEILPPHLSVILLPLRELIGQMSIRDRLPQIEVAVGEHMTALVLRILDPPTATDEDLLRAFADRHGVVFYLQPQGPATAWRFHPLGRTAPVLPAAGLSPSSTSFRRPSSRRSITRSIASWCAAPWRCSSRARRPRRRHVLRAGQLHAADCPLRRPRRRRRGQCRTGSSRAENAAANGLEDRRISRRQSLRGDAGDTGGSRPFDKMLIDPPREGALELVKSLGADGPQRIVYISCSPATLARDAAILVTQKDYRLRGAGVVNMFPNTSHVESIALFERTPAS